MKGRKEQNKVATGESHVPHLRHEVSLSGCRLHCTMERCSQQFDCQLKTYTCIIYTATG